MSELKFRTDNFQVDTNHTSKLLNLTTATGIIGRTHYDLDDILLVTGGKSLQIYSADGKLAAESKTDNRIIDITTINFEEYKNISNGNGGNLIACSIAALTNNNKDGSNIELFSFEAAYNSGKLNANLSKSKVYKIGLNVDKISSDITNKPSNLYCKIGSNIVIYRENNLQEGIDPTPISYQYAIRGFVTLYDNTSIKKDIKSTREDVFPGIASLIGYSPDLAIGLTYYLFSNEVLISPLNRGNVKLSKFSTLPEQINFSGSNSVNQIVQIPKRDGLLCLKEGILEYKVLTAFNNTISVNYIRLKKLGIDDKYDISIANSLRNEKGKIGFYF